MAERNPGPSSAPLLPETTVITERTYTRKLSLSRQETLVNTLYDGWRSHIYTFVGWLVLSIAAVVAFNFTDSLDRGEAFILAVGAWFGLVGSIIYFLPIPVRYNPRRIKRLAVSILVFSVFAFVTDFPIFVGIVWSMKNSSDNNHDNDNDVVLGISACLLFLHGCFSIVTFAKCMIIGTYEIPDQY